MVRMPVSSHEEPESVIPYGCYCYQFTGRRVVNGQLRLTTQVCPFWSRVGDAPEQMDGYCHYLGSGDLDSEGFSLLWDLCKECDVNDDWDETEWMYG